MAKNEQAFPRSGNEWDSMEWVPAKAENGMSLRDYFAAKAMQSFLTRETKLSEDLMMYAGAAYDVADSMLEARK